MVLRTTRASHSVNNNNISIQEHPSHYRPDSTAEVGSIYTNIKGYLLPHPNPTLIYRAHHDLICLFKSTLSTAKLTTTTYTEVGQDRLASRAPTPLKLSKPP